MLNVTKAMLAGNGSTTHNVHLFFPTQLSFHRAAWHRLHTRWQRIQNPWATAKDLGQQEWRRGAGSPPLQVPQHKPGEYREMLETIAEGLGVQVPAEQPAPHRHLTEHLMRNNFTYNIISKSHFWWQLSHVQHTLHQFWCPGLAQSPRQTFGAGATIKNQWLVQNKLTPSWGGADIFFHYLLIMYY